MSMKSTKNSKSKAHQRYRLKDKTIVPGATTITGLLAKPQLIKWSNNLGLKGLDVSKYVDDKADIGTLAHNMVEDYLTGKQTNFDDFTPKQKSQAENSVLSFFEWEKNHKVEVIFVEKQLVSEIHKYGGTGDIYAIVDGVKELIELKTGSGIYDEYYIQTAANVYLLRENGHPVDRARILNIPRDENECFYEAIVSQIDLNFEIFKNLLNVYYLRKKLGKEV